MVSSPRPAARSHGVKTLLSASVGGSACWLRRRMTRSVQTDVPASAASKTYTCTPSAVTAAAVEGKLIVYVPPVGPAELELHAMPTSANETRRFIAGARPP